jgi:hypothetical protein
VGLRAPVRRPRSRSSGSRRAGNRTAGTVPPRAARDATARDATARAATARAAVGRRRARRRARAAPVPGVWVLGDRARPVVPARRPSRHAGSRRPVEAVRVRRHSASVRQPVLAAGTPSVGGRPRVGHALAVGHGAAGRRPGVRRAVRRSRVRPAVLRPAMRRTAVWRRSARRPGVRRPGVRHRPVRPAVIRYAAMAKPAVRRPSARGSAVRGSARREAARLARVRPSWLAEPLPGRHLAWPAQQLSVVVFLDFYRSAWPGRIIALVVGRGVAVVGGVGPRVIAAAISLASGRTVRVTAEAGVATFHQIPPGPLCPAAPRDICPYVLSVRRQKSPV